MADETTMWKQRYQFAVEAMDGARREHQEFQREMIRALNRLALACEGQDEVLDHELRELRAFLRLRELPREVLASKIDAMEHRLRVVSRKDGTGDPRVTEAIATLLDQVETSRPPRDTARAAELLRKELKSSGTDPLTLLQRAVALRVLPEVAQPAPERAEAAPASQKPAENGLLSRLFGGRDAAPARAGAQPAAPPADEGPEPLDDRARLALDALVDTVRPDSEDPALQKTYEGAKSRVARELFARELLPSIEDIRVLANAAISRSRDEFGNFLEQVAERLDLATQSLGSGSSREAAREEHANALDAAMKAGLDGIREEVAAARDLNRLKQDVSNRLEGIGRALEAYRERESRIRAETAEDTRALVERVAELQQQTRLAEAVIAEQRKLALTDNLTRLPNREAWMQRLAEEYERWRRQGQPLTLAICDVDRFKSVNDQHGHAAGDAVLKTVATCLRESLREADFVARFGGEEFVLLMPDTSPDRAAKALENVRRAIAGLAIELPGRNRLKITASFGVAGFGEGDNPDRVFTRADSALYQAKGAGRDRIQVYSGDGAPG